MIYQMIHKEPIQNKAIANYVDTKRYDPTQLSDNVSEQIASPISSLFALGNKKSRQRRKIEQYREEIEENKDKNKDSSIYINTLTEPQK